VTEYPNRKVTRLASVSSSDCC